MQEYSAVAYSEIISKKKLTLISEMATDSDTMTVPEHIKLNLHSPLIIILGS
jgi:hypothetical protein